MRFASRKISDMKLRLARQIDLEPPTALNYALVAIRRSYGSCLIFESGTGAMPRMLTIRLRVAV